MRARRSILVCLIAAALAGCGSSAHIGESASIATTASSTGTTTSRAPRPAPAALHVVRTLGRLPAPRSGVAAAVFGSDVVVAGGLSPAGTSTATIFVVDPRGHVRSSAQIPGPVHDAAATALAGRLLLFGGGQFEGSDRVIQLAPGAPRLLGALPQALSDLTSVTIGARAYVLGGWNGSATNRDVYAVTAAGAVSVAGRIPLGVRYPAVAALGGHVIIAGGETTSGAPTPAAWSFDPGNGRVTRLPDLPAPTDHGSGAVLAGRFYLLGGLRGGSFSRAILSWAPGQTRWRRSGRLPEALADTGAVAFDGGIVVVGGRGAGGKVATVMELAPR